ncbi:MAG: VanW family protein [Microgenomates group bacterium Gr01-1014_80]|nr:MAG: VanW family protein [Microgenomates group bacterium Gr01-1014_80]
MAKKKKIPKAALPGGLITALILLLFLTFEVIFEDKFFPRTFIGNTHLVYLTRAQAYQLLSAKYDSRLQNKLPLAYQDDIFTIDLATSSAEVKVMEAINKLFETGHQNNLNEKLMDQVKLLTLGKITTPDISLSLDEQTEKIAKAVLKKPKDALISLETKPSTSSASLKITPGESGQELNNSALEAEIKNYIVFGIQPALLPIKTIEPTVTTAKAEKAKKFIEDLSSEPVKLTFEDQSWTVDQKQLLNLLNLETDALIDNGRLINYLKDLSEKINQPVQEGQFTFEPGIGRVSLFKPSQEGRELDIEKTAALITLALEGSRAKTITLPVSITEPKIKVENVNNLGIKELIGRGISNFAGSIPNRIYNLNLTASKMNGVLIPPGEVFSFNQTVGDVSAETGFKQAYVIKSGRTVLDDGGGVCQDSTTLFRAVLNAGLPVVSRTAHAYRVSYYEQGFPPGLDATVFHPSVDFKFKNDTSAHILIQAYTSGVTLYVDLYGTSDGRVSTISKSVVTNQTPPPPELRQDDPTLPRGEVKQVDWPAWGATVTFNRAVTRGGETIINETFRSVYKPWQAVYLVGTKEG